MVTDVGDTQTDVIWPWMCSLPVTVQSSWSLSESWQHHSQSNVWGRVSSRCPPCLPLCTLWSSSRWRSMCDMFRGRGRSVVYVVMTCRSRSSILWLHPVWIILGSWKKTPWLTATHTQTRQDSPADKTFVGLMRNTWSSISSELISDCVETLPWGVTTSCIMPGLLQMTLFLCPQISTILRWQPVWNLPENSVWKTGIPTTSGFLRQVSSTQKEIREQTNNMMHNYL